MKIETYLKRKTPGSPLKGMAGEESDWLDVCGLHIALGKVRVVDPSYGGDRKRGFSPALPPGGYQARLKVIAYASERRVSRLRLAPANAQSILGPKIGQAWTDTARLGICEPPFAEAYRRDKELASKVVEEAMYKTQPYAVARLGRGSDTTMLIVESGFGDGTFPVYELRRGSERVGIETVFINPDEPYPFDAEKEATDERLEKDKALHWSLIQKHWDPAWSALRQGEAPAREFFLKLSPGQRALLAIEIANRGFVPSLSGVEQLFRFQANGALVADELLSAYELLGAEEYAGRFRQVLSLCRPVAQAGDVKTKWHAWRDLIHGPNGGVIDAFQDWFKQVAQNANARIEAYICRYAKRHSDEFEH